MQKERNCDMFLVHDDDLECIDGLVCLFSYQLDRSFHIRVLVAQVSPTRCIDGLPPRLSATDTLL
jgi:hypothetical protein